MKTKLVIAMSALAIAGLTSCEKDLYDPNQTQEEKKVTDLVIPEGFDWEMTKTATCNVTSDHSAQFSIYLDEACTESNLLATVPVKAGTNLNLPLSLLMNTQKVYVQYESATGKKTVTAPVDAHGNISFVAPVDSKKTTTRAEGDEKLGTTIYYPKNSDGTMMFEDNYPVLGDYDFNDFVARYMAEVTLSADGESVAKVVLTMNIVAIGGIKPYVPCLRLPYNKNLITEAKVEYEKGVTDSTIELEIKGDNSSKENAVFFFNGAEINADKQGQFLNTEKETTFVRTKAFTLTVTFEKDAALTTNLDKNLLDIFLAYRDRSKEIHMFGYNPAFGEIDNSSPFYDTKTNITYKVAEAKSKGLVWAINIPSGEVVHAYEKESFTNAYPTFAAWAESGGAQDNKWYETKNLDFLFPIK